MILFALLATFGVQDAGQEQALPEVPPKQEFKIEARPTFVIMPADADLKKPVPWIWYAPTLPGLPEAREDRMFRQFLARGIAIAGMDVGERYGSPAGRRLFNTLYDELVQNRGFAPVIRHSVPDKS